MQLSFFEQIIWAATMVLQFVVAAIVFRNGIYRLAPTFSLFIWLHAARSPILALVKGYAGDAGYFWTYWIVDSCLLIVELAVVQELYERLLPAAGKLAMITRGLFWVMSAIAITMGIGTALGTTGSPDHQIMAGILMLQRSIRVTECTLLLLVFTTLYWLNVHATRLFLAIAIGLTAVAAVALLAIAGRAFYGPAVAPAFRLLTTGVYVPVLWLWILTLAKWQASFAPGERSFALREQLKEV